MSCEECWNHEEEKHNGDWKDDQKIGIKAYKAVEGNE